MVRLDFCMADGNKSGNISGYIASHQKLQLHHLNNKKIVVVVSMSKVKIDSS